MNQEAKVEVPVEDDPRKCTTNGVVLGALPVITYSVQPGDQEEDFLQGSTACSLDGEGTCESCQ